MDISPRIGAGIAAFGMVVFNAMQGPVSAAPLARVFTGLRPAQPNPASHTRQSRGRSAVSGCTTDGDPGYYFIGIPSEGNVAAEFSAVLGGENNEACDGATGVGAGYGNVVGSGGGQAGESFIGGGNSNQIAGGNSFLGSGYYNQVTGADAFVGAGFYGTAGGQGSFEGSGGYAYYVAHEPTSIRPYFVNPMIGTGNGATGNDAFVGSGDLNVVTGNGSMIGSGGYTYAAAGKTGPGNQISGTDSFLGAGDVNVVGGSEAFLGGGDANTVNATESFLGGGYANTVASAATFSAIGGGNSNVAMATYEAIGGGYDNVAKGADATIPGGNRNEAYGALSFAAGYQAHALYSGSFVWSDFHSGSSALADTAAGQFVVRASGGTYIYSNEADTAGVKLAAGSGAWSNLSDRNAKTNIVPLDEASILSKVVTLPISAWQYKTEHGVTHLGPMAQDFYAAFGAGEDDRHITSIDEDGVALAAIKALNAKLERRDNRLRVENGRMQSELATLAERNTNLERRVDALAARLP